VGNLTRYSASGSPRQTAQEARNDVNPYPKVALATMPCKAPQKPSEGFRFA